MKTLEQELVDKISEMMTRILLAREIAYKVETGMCPARPEAARELHRLLTEAAKIGAGQGP
jgi:hypothetical protein